MGTETREGRETLDLMLSWFVDVFKDKDFDFASSQSDYSHTQHFTDLTENRHFTRTQFLLMDFYSSIKGLIQVRPGHRINGKNKQNVP